MYVLPPFRQSCYIIFLHPVVKETCTQIMNVNLLGASFYYVNRQFGCTGAIACHNSGDTEEVIIIETRTYRPSTLQRLLGLQGD